MASTFYVLNNRGARDNRGAYEGDGDNGSQQTKHRRQRRTTEKTHFVFFVYLRWLRCFVVEIRCLLPLRAGAQKRARSRESQVQRLRRALVEREARGMFRRALEPRRIAPFALRHVLDRNGEVRAWRQIRDLVLTLLIGARGRHP